MKRVWVLFAFLCFAICFMHAGNAAEEPSLSDISMLDQHGAMMLLIDADTGNIVYANKAAVSFYGYSKEALLSMKISQINTLSEEKIAEEMQAAQTEKRNFFTFEHRTSSGAIKTVEVYSYPVQLSDKRVLYSVIHDVTDAAALAAKQSQLETFIFIAGAITIAALLFLSLALFKSRQRIKSAKDAVEYSEKLHRTFIDADDSMIYLKDENLKYIFVNKATEQFYQRRKDQIIGQSDFDLSDKAFAQMRRITDLKALQEKQVVFDEVEWDGKVYKTLKFPVTLPNGKVGLGAYITDITKTRAFEIQQEKNARRNKILADMLSISFESTQAELEYVIGEILKLTESQYGYIYLYDEEKRRFSLISWSDSVQEACGIKDQQSDCDLDKTGVWGEAVRQRRPIIINDYDAPNDLKKGLPQGHIKLKSFMSVPVIIDQKIVAVVGVANKASDYDEDDIRETMLLMSDVWNAVTRRETQEKLSLERKKYQQTLLSIGDGVMVVDEHGLIEILNPIAEELIGWPLHSVIGKPYKDVFSLSHEQTGKAIMDPIAAALETQAVQEMENHAVLTSKNGTRYCLEDSASPIKDESGAVIGVVLVFRNVTEKKEQQHEIEYLSFHDSLTGLYNRRFFEEELRRLDTPRNLPISILIGDVNNLKLTNDIFGHTYGDQLLKRLAHVLKKICRADDIIARWGGDEFSLLLPKTSLEEARQIAARVRDEFSKERIKAVQGSISMGAAVKLGSENDIIDIVNKAEEEMYTSKIMEHSDLAKDTLHTIVQMLHESSPRERDHAEGVSRLCQAMGKKLNMSEDEIKRLYDAGYLHDIGKVVLDSKLLANQFNHLSTMEWNEIKRHPVVGYRILNSFDDTLDIAQIVLAHQERWDGTGYPKGLKGDEIPLAARIIALVESYERKRSGADNRESLSKEDALAAISQASGLHFDPQLTDLFIAMMEGTDSDSIYLS